MPRVYMSSEVRQKQVVRLVIQYPGITIPVLAHALGLSYPHVCALMVRLVKDERVSVGVRDPALGAKQEQKFYPPGQVPMKRAAA